MTIHTELTCWRSAAREQIRGRRQALRAHHYAPAFVLVRDRPAGWPASTAFGYASVPE